MKLSLRLVARIVDVEEQTMVQSVSCSARFYEVGWEPTLSRTEPLPVRLGPFPTTLQHKRNEYLFYNTQRRLDLRVELKCLQRRTFRMRRPIERITWRDPQRIFERWCDATEVCMRVPSTRWANRRRRTGPYWAGLNDYIDRACSEAVLWFRGTRN